MPAERFKAFLERTRSEMADVIANCTYSDNFHAVVDRIAELSGSAATPAGRDPTAFKP